MDAILPGFSSALNIHPMFVHFPLVLWLTALFFCGLALALGRDAFWDAGRWLLYLGALAALATVGTGLWAEEHLGHQSPGHDLVHVHRNWMLSSTGLGLLTAFAVFATREKATRGVRWLVCGLLLTTVVVSALGADRGALLVYRYGIGTRVDLAPPAAAQEPENGHRQHDH